MRKLKEDGRLGWLWIVNGVGFKACIW